LDDLTEQAQAGPTARWLPGTMRFSPSMRALTRKTVKEDRLMKKVRYAIGAAGVAPALGLMIPAANAATTVTHAPKQATKTVSLAHGTIPLLTCHATHSKHALSAHANLDGTIWWSGALCVHEQQAFLYKHQTGLTERVRYYSGGGALEYTGWQAGHLGFTSTSFSSHPSIYAHEVCQALVLNTNHNTVKYGPVCETT
jgi:hypothetical protein